MIPLGKRPRRPWHTHVDWQSLGLLALLGGWCVAVFAVGYVVGEHATRRPYQVALKDANDSLTLCLVELSAERVPTIGEWLVPGEGAGSGDEITQ